MRLQAIGVLRTPWATPADCPRNGRLPEPAPECRAEIDARWHDALDGLDGFSHLLVLYWLGPTPTPLPLRITPRFAAVERGVFATRAPVRPNPIGITVARFDGWAAAGVLRLRYLDCADRTPLLDIKPYLPTVDAEPDASMGWLAGSARPGPCVEE